MDHELPGVLDGTDEPATVEELEGVVRRASSRRRARLAAGAAALLTLGAVGGAVAAAPGRDSGVGFAKAKEPTTIPPPRPDTVTGAFGDMAGPRPSLKPLFRREANGVAIRAYTASWSAAGSDKPRCGAVDTISGELSNGAAVATAMAPLFDAGTAATARVSILATSAFGQDEGEEATWLIVRSSGVAQVRVTSGTSSDTMEAKDGLAILIVHGTGAPTVEGLAADGTVLTNGAAEPPQPPPADPGCMPPPCVSEGQGPVPAIDPGPMTADEKAAVAARAAAIGESHVIIEDGFACDTKIGPGSATGGLPGGPKAPSGATSPAAPSTTAATPAP